MQIIDVHVHPSTRGLDPDAYAYFRRELKDLPTTEETFAQYFSSRQAKALLIAWHPSTVNEEPRVTNKYVLALVKKYPEAFAGVLGSLDMSSDNSDGRIRRAEELGKNPLVKGFKFHPPDQGFYPNDKKYYSLWETLAALGKPLMFHTGFTVLGAGAEGGKGIGLDYGRPIHLDTVARDFPRMKIVAAHPGWPWQEELLGVVTHKKNVYVDTSGYLAEQLPELFLKTIRGRLQDKALFGTDFPYVDLGKALESYDRLGLKENAKEKILFANARALFEL
ncbi:MAG: amidohydrolase [Deltaproteobacteria bacterium]|nr:amidohydrolase [Deltaproteobacteria bacterium]